MILMLFVGKRYRYRYIREVAPIIITVWIQIRT